MNGIDGVRKYRMYLRLIFELLDRQEYVVGDVEEVQKLFVENLKKMIVATLDMSFDADSFEKLYYEYRRDGKLNDERVMQVCMNMVENEETYAVLNSYFEAFLRSYVKNCRVEYREDIWGKINKKLVSI